MTQFERPTNTASVFLRAVYRWMAAAGTVVGASASAAGILIALGASPSAATLNLTGTWTGTGTDSQGSSAFTWQLTQTGNTVTGTARMTGGSGSEGTCAFCHKSKAAGTFFGTLSGDSLTFELTFPDGGESDPTPICSIVMNGAVANVATTMVATYTGIDSCEGPFTGGVSSIVLTSAPPSPAPSPPPPPAPPPPAPPPPGPPPPPTPTPFAPSVSAIASQYLSPDSSVTLSFRVSGAVDADRIAVGVAAFDTSLFPTTAFTLTHAAGGVWTLVIKAPANRTGATVIEVIADDGYQIGTQGFVATVAHEVAPNRPTSVVATASGSGIVLTWIAPAAPAQRYVIAGGTAADRVTLPAIVTADTTTTYAIPSVPPGTYFFRVHALVNGALSLPSDVASVVAAGAPAASGPPSGLTIAVSGSTVTIDWKAPEAPTGGYQIEAGSGPGLSDVAVVQTIAPHASGSLPKGTYYIRVRAVNGAAISAPSNEVSAPVAPGTCAAAAGAPILLPASVAGGVVTLSWLPAAGEAADRYRLEVVSSDGPFSLLTAGAGTSVTGGVAAGVYAVRVAALNACGASASSNEISFVR